MPSNTSVKALDYIIEEMLEVAKNSKDEIFYISEEAQKEYEQLSKELTDIKEKVSHYIEKGDTLEYNVKKSRQKLLVVSKDFDITAKMMSVMFMNKSIKCKWSWR